MFPTIPVLEPPQLEPIAIVQKVEQLQEPKIEPKPAEYIIKPNDNLTKIAEAHRTSVKRLWDANSHIDHPDKIEPNKTLKIPQDGEQLPDRPLPTPLPTPTTHIATTPNIWGGRGSVAGNTYTRGYCTWYVKNMRPDLPNNLGNADTWYSRAAAQGMSVGSTPRVGAVAATKAYMHVALVVSIDGDRVLVKEMNYKAWNVVSTRWTSASEFLYIY